MGNKKVSWRKPDKIIKDLIWDDLVEASEYSNGKLLDIGCGDKPYLSIFSNKIKAYIGLDIKNEKADIIGDIFSVNIGVNEFNTVLCTQVIEHVKDPIKLLYRINKIMKKKGILILTAPFVGSLHEMPNDYYRYTKFSLKYLLEESGFNIVYIKEQGNWVSSISYMIGFYLESTGNVFLIRYFKILLQIILQYFLYTFSLLPSKYTKPEFCPMNYIVVASKK